MFRRYKNATILSYLFILVNFVLSGCSSIPDEQVQVNTKQSPKERTVKLEQLQQWQITGKIAFIEKDSRHSATLLWKADESQKYQQLNLTTYLGISLLQLDSLGNSHTIKANGETYQGNNLEQLIHSITGLTLPTNALSFWLKGIPFQKSDNISYHAITQLPQTLSSDYNNELWQVSYTDYRQISGYNLATKFTIKKDDLMIKIAINEWEVLGE